MKFGIFIILWGFTFHVFSQNKILTVKDAEIGARRELYPSYLANLNWRGPSEKFTYQTNNTVYQQSVSDTGTEALITLYDINQSIKSFDTLRTLPYITWENENEFHLFSNKYWFAFKMPGNQLIAYIKLPDDGANYKIYYPKKLIAFTKQNNVYILGYKTPAYTVTTDLNPDIVNGDIVSRNEFGINEGLFWSPNGNYLAFYRKDNSKVKNYPLVDITSREAQLKNIKYPMAGMASEHISVGIFNLNNQSSIFIDKDDTISEKYLTNVSWSPDEKNIYIQVLNREQNHLWMNRYSVSGGILEKTLFEETNDKYVEPLNPIYFLSESKDKFVYFSRKDGYHHAYLCDTSGRFLKQITKGDWEVTDFLVIDPDNNMFYLSTEGSPLEQHAWKINIPSGKKTELTTNPGYNYLIVNKYNGFGLNQFSSTTVPRTINLINRSGKIIRSLLTATNPLSKYNMPEMKIGTIKAADKTTDLYYRLIKPLGFKESVKYPVILYVYGGPHTQLITNSWLGGARLWDYMMAQKGYIVFTVDNRGSSNRGLAFENVIHRQCGQNEMLDQIEGIQFLKNQDFIDTTRIGVFGWSYGGFMTTSLMLNYPDIFKVGVAGGPVIDWKYYEVMYGERYMDKPEENPLGYEKTSLLNKVNNLKGKLMIIHGAVDPTVVWQNSLLFIQECIKNQIPVDYFVYPLSEHNMRGYDRVHLMEKITGYFDSNL